MDKPVPSLVTKTKDEALAVSVIRLNQWFQERHPSRKIHKDWEIGPYIIRFRYTSKDDLWGRLGGGWQWGLGFQCSGCSVLIILLVCEIIISKRRPTDVPV